MSVRIIYICVKKCPFFDYNGVKKISPAALHFINVNPPLSKIFDRACQDYNAMTVISKVYTYFVLQCTVSGW